MSEYTTTIHALLKNNFDLGLQEYAIFDEEYRPILNNAIIKFYEFREIGFTNPTMFKNRLNARIDLIMRNKYNALYDIKKTEFNPLYNIELHENYTRTLDNTVNDSGIQNIESDTKVNEKTNNTNDTHGFSSRYPSDSLTSNDLTSPLYADVGNKQEVKGTLTSESKETNKQDVTTKNETTGKTVEEYTHTTEGSSAGLPFSKAMLQFKQYIEKYDLDNQVIAELSDLFINVW